MDDVSHDPARPGIVVRGRYSLLSAAQQELLRAVSVFAGGFTGPAVDGLVARLDPQRRARLASRGGRAGHLGALEARSLVVREAGGRLRLPGAVRRFAAGEQGSVERDATRRAHLRWLVDLAEEAATAGWDTGRDTGWDACGDDRLAHEGDNIRAAFDTARAVGDLESGQRLGAALVRHWHRHGAVAEGITLLREFLARAGRDGVPLTVTARAWLALGTLHHLAGDNGEAHRLTTLAGDLASLAGDVATEARSLGRAAHLAVLAGADRHRAVAAAERGARLAATLGDDRVRTESAAALRLVRELVAAARP
ncbi:hypothetical protein Daura_27300 [Dactylosporangium aurantiacum]|uniref:Uncharacterized protein n=1 Tax=Dactylosporangium aurantiacum TaxID=35754 RepID=A0A9Q9I6H6_9ACTN|nr:hypothetical protein [Dactylosporangium aurantiacum]MDG6106426.1 hypothetical protein [Dactylosporangium aurantiacum]UWZ50534.1 hypothetical protein Daura_27300 [Dactylosporangium aurantiacum]